MGAPLRAVFMGTPSFALGPLEALHESPAVEVALVVTRPDAASGRGSALVPSPVKARALELGLPVLETKSLRGAEVQERLAAVGADVFCVAAYGAILPTAVLDMPRLGCLNVHASLLPRGRGAAPMQRALLEGEPELGYSIMRIEEGLDTGPYCAQGSVEVAGRNYDEVAAEVSRRGGEALAGVLATLAEGGALAWVQQDDALATYAAKIDKSEVLLAPDATATENMHRVQASGDAAPARCVIAGRPARVLRARPLGSSCDGGSQAQGGAAEGLPGGLPGRGEVLRARRRVILGCSEGALEVLELKPDGKRAMGAADFAAGMKEERSTWGVR